MLKDWINPKYLDIQTIKKLKLEFDSLEWTKVLIFEDFLQIDKFQSLSEEILSYPLEKKIFWDMYDNYESWIPVSSLWYKYLTECIESDEFKKILSFILWTRVDTPWKEYAKVNVLRDSENYFNRHTDYQMDNPYKHGTSRLYLHKEWKEEYGGNLELWTLDLTEEEKRHFDDIWSLWISFNSDRFQTYKKIFPKPNLLFYLKIEKTSYHRISQVHAPSPRYTLWQKWYLNK